MADIKTRTTWTELDRVFCHYTFIFSYVQKYFYGPLTKGDRPHRPPWIRHWLGFQSEQVAYMLTTSGCQVDFASSTLCGSLRKTSFHTHTSCPSMNKSEVQSRLASGTSPLKLIAKTLSYQDVSFPAWNCQLAHRTLPFAMTVTAAQSSALQ